MAFVRLTVTATSAAVLAEVFALLSAILVRYRFPTYFSCANIIILFLQVLLFYPPAMVVNLRWPP